MPRTPTVVVVLHFCHPPQAKGWYSLDLRSDCQVGGGQCPELARTHPQKSLKKPENS